jgi:hypothetical protein
MAGWIHQQMILVGVGSGLLTLPFFLRLGRVDFRPRRRGPEVYEAFTAHRADDNPVASNFHVVERGTTADNILPAGFIPCQQGESVTDILLGARMDVVGIVDEVNGHDQAAILSTRGRLAKLFCLGVPVC